MSDKRQNPLERLVNLIPIRTSLMVEDLLKEREYAILSRLELLGGSLKNLEDGMTHVAGQIANAHESTRITREDVMGAQRELFALRGTSAYGEVFTKRDPLVSVRIATYNRADLLLTKALPSILAQTYRNIEVVIVGDHCTDDTAERIEALNDSRVRFYNLYNRSPYPEDRIKKWQVIGALPMNTAASLCRGQWIAPLDDDDEFSPDHIEVLVRHALSTRSEFIYGAMTQRNLVTGTEEKIWASEPAQAKISLNGALYMNMLGSIFSYDQYGWLANEPGDWNMIRRMQEAGVTISSLDYNVGILNMIPAGHDRKDY